MWDTSHITFLPSLTKANPFGKSFTVVLLTLAQITVINTMQQKKVNSICPFIKKSSCNVYYCTKAYRELRATTIALWTETMDFIQKFLQIWLQNISRILLIVMVWSRDILKLKKRCDFCDLWQYQCKSLSFLLLLRWLKVAVLKLLLSLPLLQTAIMEICAILKAQIDAAANSSKTCCFL